MNVKGGKPRDATKAALPTAHGSEGRASPCGSLGCAVELIIASETLIMCLRCVVAGRQLSLEREGGAPSAIGLVSHPVLLPNNNKPEVRQWFLDADAG